MVLPSDMMHTRRLLVAMSVAALSGCATPAASSGSPQAASAALVADFRGVGAVRAGMRLAQVIDSVGGVVDTSGGPVSDTNCSHAFLSALPPGIGIMVFGDTVVRVDVDTTGVLTTEGIGVGSTEPEVRRAYREAMIRQEPHPYAGPDWRYLIIDPPMDSLHRIIIDPPMDSLHRIIMETDGIRVRSYRVGWQHAVDQIEGCA